MDANDLKARFAPRAPDFYGGYASTPPVRKGSEWRMPCPIHKGDGLNFVVYQDGSYCCFSRCGNGDIFNFLEQIDGMAYIEAKEKIADYCGVTIEALPVAPKGKKAKPEPREENKKPTLLDTSVALAAHQKLLDSPKMLAWLLARRGLTLETVKKYYLGLDQHPEDEQAGVWRVTIPVYDAQGHLLNIRRHLFAYKADLTPERRKQLDKTKPWRAGLSSCLYPVSVLDDVKSVLILEGEADTLLAIQMGFFAVTGTLGAETFKQEWVAAFAGVDEVIVLYDGDEAGNRGRLKVVALLSDIVKTVRLGTYPDGVKDFTEWVMEHGATTDDVQLSLDAAGACTPSSPGEQAPTSVTETGDLPAPLKAKWPVANDAIYHGLAGQIIDAIRPHTEADPIAILASILIGMGNVVGRSPHFKIEATRHYCNLFGVIVGRSAVGRKGTSLDHAVSVIRQADEEWVSKRLLAGLSSGEGLINPVRDPVERLEPVREKGKVVEYQMVVVDPGVEDKRLLVVETEFAKVLKVSQREGNTLSAVMRQGWDSGNLRVMTKQAQSATDAHISIIGHITQHELIRELNDTEVANGFANRFLWVCATRSQLLPEGGDLESVYMTPLYDRFAAAVAFASEVGQMRRDEDARAVWAEVYPKLTRETPGLFGAVIARAAPIVVRLSMIYALLDKSDVIRADHLLAALAFWDYAEASTRYIFGSSLGDPFADELLRALQGRPDGMTQTEIRDLVNRNGKPGQIMSALESLQVQGLVRCQKEPTGGKPTTRWFAA